METIGREREKALLRDNPYYRGGYEPHFSVIDIFHDRAEGLIGVDEALDRVLGVMDKTLVLTLFDTVSHWFSRARGDDPAFETFPVRLASHKLADVRALAPRLMREPQSDAEHAVFGRLLADRSAKVRQATAHAAEARRWLSVTEMLKRYAEALPDPQEKARVLMQCDFIAQGYRVAGGRVTTTAARHRAAPGRSRMRRRRRLLRCRSSGSHATSWSTATATASGRRARRATSSASSFWWTGGRWPSETAEPQPRA